MKQKSTQRGMKKWMPFNALEHYDDYISSTYSYKEKIERPILSDEQIQSINTSLIEYNHDEVEITFFKQGEIRKIQGIINKIDVPNQVLMINKVKILFINLLKINPII